MKTYEEYLRRGQEYWRRAEKYLKAKDYLQASEKSWGASAAMVKAVAEKRGWRYDSHKELFRIVSRLSRETSDEELKVAFGLANQLHVNFYEDWLPPDTVKSYRNRIRGLLLRLEELANGRK